MTTQDVIIIGGSYAGLSAALQLARARRSILMLDGGERRNRFATHAHGFLTRDGESPAEIARIGREQLLAYPTVTWRDTRVTAARRIDDDTFEVVTADDVHRGKRLLLAYGITDQLPPVPGLQERWGKTVFHCPYCHGYELDRAAVAVLATGPMSHHQAMMLPDWGPTTFFTQGYALEPDVRAGLDRRGVTIEPTHVVEARGDDRIELVTADGRTHTFAGLFVASQTRPSTDLASQLDCTLAESPVGIYVATDETKETSVRNVFAGGDLTLPMSSVALAVADGARAGAGVHRSLMFR